MIVVSDEMNEHLWDTQGGICLECDNRPRLCNGECGETCQFVDECVWTVDDFDFLDCADYAPSHFAKG